MRLQLLQKYYFLILRIKQKYSPELGKTYKRGVREIQNEWFNTRADEMKIFAEKHDTRHFYQAIKIIYGHKLAKHLSPFKTLIGNNGSQ